MRGSEGEHCECASRKFLGADRCASDADEEGAGVSYPDMELSASTEAFTRLIEIARRQWRCEVARQTCEGSGAEKGELK